MADNQRDVNLSIRAKDLSTGTIKEIEQAVRSLSGGLRDMTQAAIRGEAASSDLARAQKELSDAGRGLAKIGQQVQKYEELNTTLAEAKAKLEALAAAQAKAAQAVDGNANATKKQQRELATATRDVERQTKTVQGLEERVKGLSTSLEKAGVDLRNTSAAMTQAASIAREGQTAIQGYANAQAGLAKSTKEYAEAERAKQQAANRLKETADAEAQARAYTRLADATSSLAAARARRPGDAALGIGAEMAAPRDITGLQGRTAAAAGIAAQSLAQQAPVADYLAKLQEMERLMRRTEQLAGKVDGYRAQADAVKAAGQNIVQANRAVAEATQQYGANAMQTRIARDAQREAARQWQDSVLRLRVLRDELREAGINTRDLAAAQTRLVETSRSLRSATADLNTAFAQFGGARTGAPGVLGLRPYELTNLSFQVNDFFTQLASGTSVMQAFMQQIGQVVQIQPIANALRAAALPVLGLAVAFGTLTAALARYADQQATIREATARQTLVGSSGSGGFGSVTPQAVERATNAARQAGGDWEQSRNAAMRMMNLPVQLTAEQYQQLVVATTNLGQANRDAAGSVDRVAEALRGGNDEFRKFFGEVVRVPPELVRAYTEAQTTEARVDALNRVLQSFSEIAQDARNRGASPLGDAFLQLRNAWQGFLDTLNNAGVAAVGVATLNAIKGAVEGLTTAMRTLGTLPSFIALFGGVVSANPMLGPQVLSFANRARGWLGLGSGAQPGAADAAQGGGTVIDVSPRSNFTDDRTPAQVAQEDAAERNLAATIRQRLEDEALTRALDRQANARQRLAGLEAAQNRARREFAERNPGATPEQINTAGLEGRAAFQFRLDEAARSNADANAAEVRRDFEAINREIRSVISLRTDAYRIIQEDMASGAISGAEGLRRLQRAAEEARPDLERLTAEAREFARVNSGGTAIGRMTMQTGISTAERALSANGIREQVNTASSRENQRVSQMFQERGTMVQTINQLRESGAITTAEAQERIRAAYAATNNELREAIDRLEEYNNAARDAGAPATAVDLVTARIQLFRQQLTYIDPEMTRLRENFTQTFSQGMSSAIGGVADALAGVISGSQRLGSVWSALRNGFLSLISSVLRGLAETIIRTQALALAQQTLNWLGMTGDSQKGGKGGGGGGFNWGGLITSAIGAIGGFFGGGAEFSFSKFLAGPMDGGMKFHSGGVVGLGGTPTKVNPSWFANAPRYHSGGVVGLAPDERAAVLQTGEEVLSRNDPRNIMNGLKARSEGGGAATSIKQVLVMNEDELRQAMNSKAGEQIIITHLKRNRGTVRAILA